ncbi:viroplasmin family protein [Bacterioplanoides sp.]|uniref:ribonuclease H1 domain-containing protein n=1 Tax=Bacterioplanoides sp. TaxID=2066072 RepID=UPI003B5C1DB8
MAKKFYVIWAGHEPGIYSDWPTAKKQVDGFPGARYKSFTSEAEALAAYGRPATVKAAGSGSKTKSKPAAKAETFTTDYTFYCDGGCEPNPGKAGSGIAIYRADQLIQLWYGMYNPNGTNNSAELNALYQSLVLSEKVIAQGKTAQIRCDSMYSIQCIRDWAPGWEKRGWKRKDGEIQNLEIIKLAYALFNKIKDKLILSHVKAHAGTEGNELADRMTMVAVDRKNPEWNKYETRDDGSFDIAALLKMRAG